MVQCLEFLLPDPLCPADPRLLPFLIAFDPQGDDIVLHPVDLIIRKPAQPGPQMSEHALIGKVLLRHGEKAPEILHERIQQDTLLVVHEHRDLISCTRLLQRVRIHVHVRGDHRDLPVTVSFHPHKAPDLTGHIFGFCSGIPRLMQAHCLLLPLKGMPRIAEQTGFQKCHRRILPETAWRLSVKAHRVFSLHPRLPGNLRKGSHHLLAQCKKLIRMPIYERIFPLIHLHSQDHPVAHPQEFAEETVLHRCKSGEPVHRHHAPFQDP